MIKNLFFIALCSLYLGIASGQDNNGTKIKISTAFGDMIAILYDDTPLHRDNFIENVKNGVYQGALFHRVMPNFMAQGGNPASIGAAPNAGLSSDQCGTIPQEIRRNHFHKKGSLAAARTPDSVNPNRASSACQFYVVQGFRHTDAQLDAMETDSYKFPEINRATYKVKGGYPSLDMQYTIFGEVIEGLEVIDMIGAMRTGAVVAQRPNEDVIFTVEILK